MNFGQIIALVRQYVPDADLETIKSNINIQYKLLSNDWQWSGSRATTRLNTTAIYSIGTVSIAAGATAVTGSSTAWNGATLGATLPGRYIKFAGENNYYEIATYSGATSIAIATAYQGSDLTDEEYEIFQTVYLVATDCAEVRLMSYNGLVLEKISEYDYELTDPNRESTGEPTSWMYKKLPSVSGYDMQCYVELYPVPDDTYPVFVSYLKNPTDMTVATEYPFIPGDLIALRTAHFMLGIKAIQRSDRVLSALIKEVYATYSDMYSMYIERDHKLHPTNKAVTDVMGIEDAEYDGIESNDFYVNRRSIG